MKFKKKGKEKSFHSYKHRLCCIRSPGSHWAELPPEKQSKHPAALAAANTTWTLCVDNFIAHGQQVMKELLHEKVESLLQKVTGMQVIQCFCTQC